MVCGSNTSLGCKLRYQWGRESCYTIVIFVDIYNIDGTCNEDYLMVANPRSSLVLLFLLLPHFCPFHQ